MKLKANLINVAQEITSFLPDEIKARYQILIINNELFLYQIGTDAKFLINYTNSNQKNLKFEIRVNNLIISNVEALNDKKILSVKVANDDGNFKLIFSPDYSIIKLVNENESLRIYFEYENNKKRLDVGMYNLVREKIGEEFYPETVCNAKDIICKQIDRYLKFKIDSNCIEYFGVIKNDDGSVNGACISNDNLSSNAPYYLCLRTIYSKLNSREGVGYPIVGKLIYLNNDVSELLSYICDNIIPKSIDNELISILLSRMFSYSNRRKLSYSKQIMEIIECTVKSIVNTKSKCTTYFEIEKIIREHINLHPVLKFNVGKQMNKIK